jgi:hypothetical protein
MPLTVKQIISALLEHPTDMIVRVHRAGKMVDLKDGDIYRDFTTGIKGGVVLIDPEIEEMVMVDQVDEE